MTTRSITTSASDATISLFNVVNHTATTASKLVGSVATSVDMLDLFVTDAYTRQKTKSKIDMALFEKQIVEDTAMEISTRQRSIQEKLETDPKLLSLYTENVSELNAILNPVKS